MALLLTSTVNIVMTCPTLSDFVEAWFLTFYCWDSLLACYCRYPSFATIHSWRNSAIRFQSHDFCSISVFWKSTYVSKCNSTWFWVIACAQSIWWKYFCRIHIAMWSRRLSVIALYRFGPIPEMQMMTSIYPSQLLYFRDRNTCAALSKSYAQNQILYAPITIGNDSDVYLQSARRNINRAIDLTLLWTLRKRDANVSLQIERS